MALALTAVALVVFLGGFIIGELPATRQPGPFLVGAEDRSVSPQGLAAARFAASRAAPPQPHPGRPVERHPDGVIRRAQPGLRPDPRDPRDAGLLQQDIRPHGPAR